MRVMNIFSMIMDSGPPRSPEVRWETVGEGEVASWALNINGCSSTTSVLVSIGTNGLEELSGESFVVYPVP